MKVSDLTFWIKAAWQDNKPFLFFNLTLLFILSVLKIIFYNYNYHFIFGSPDLTQLWPDKLNLIRWSVFIDLFFLVLITAPLLILLHLCRLMRSKIAALIFLSLFILLNSAVVLLNLADIFYFRFHFQRANADLLYVLGHPFEEFFHLNILIILAFFLAISGVLFVMLKLHFKFFRAFTSGKSCRLTALLLLLAIALLPLYKKSFEKALVPAFPLLELNSKQLMVVQNSFYTFVYSVFRGGQEIKVTHYLPEAACDSIFPIRKILPFNNSDSTKRNIVLLIMESVPYDFFDHNSKYSTVMPFFDSLLEKSSFYNNAFCFAHQSNKGITAILSGLPTLCDIPLYHSQFVNMPISQVGIALKKNNYHSFFCIGDDYDNFGFAKCIHWLGIDQYYSKEDIPGYRHLPSHTMGLHDEFVLDFMHQKIKELPSPFFAINYNISTHYPYDLPHSFAGKFPAEYTSPMKAMVYYDHCLQQFFKACAAESWFRNTVFIFCADHWMAPDDNHIKFNAISGYRIPLIVFDPLINEKKLITHRVSQFDVMGTILSLGGYKDSIISYGTALTDTGNANKLIFSRPNSSLYQVSDSAYVLGFNPNSNKAEFLYHYISDPGLEENLIPSQRDTLMQATLTKAMRAFLQKASMQYNGLLFK